MNYILYGEQYPMIKKRLKKVLNETLGEVDDFNVVKYDFKPELIDEIIDEASMLPLGYDAKAVVIDNATFLEPKGNKEINEKINELLNNSSDSISLIFILRNENLDNLYNFAVNFENSAYVGLFNFNRYYFAFILLNNFLNHIAICKFKLKIR